MKKTGNIDDKYVSCTADPPEEEEQEIDKDWAELAKLSRAQWEKDNP